MTLANWIYFTTTGWWVWVAAVGLLAAYLVWVRATRPRQSFVPLVFAGLWLASCITYYLYTGWHHYSGRIALWVTGVASILVVAAIPLAVTIVLELVMRPVLRHHVVRTVLAGGVAVVLTLFVQRPLGVWVARVAAHLMHAA